MWHTHTHTLSLTLSFSIVCVCVCACVCFYESVFTSIYKCVWMVAITSRKLDRCWIMTGLICPWLHVIHRQLDGMSGERKEQFRHWKKRVRIYQSNCEAMDTW